MSITEVKTLQIFDMAWQKIRYCRDTADNTEIAGWLVSNSDDDLFTATHFYTTKQEVTSCTIEFDDTDLARFSHEMALKGISAARCQKIWVHTHPGNSCQPSSTDEETFAKMMNQIDIGDHLIMLIVAMDDSTYCRLSVKTEYGVFQRLLKTDIVYEEQTAWDDEFKNNISKKVFITIQSNKSFLYQPNKTENFQRNEFIPKLSIPTSQNNILHTTIGSWELSSILHSYNKDRVTDLTKKERAEICSGFDISKKDLLLLDEKLFKDELDWIKKEYEILIDEYRVDSVAEIPESEWSDIVDEKFIRKFQYFDYEATVNHLVQIGLDDSELFVNGEWYE